MTARGNWVKGENPQTTSSRGRNVDKGSEARMTFSDKRKTDRDNRVETNYDNDVVSAQNARNNQREDSDPKIEKEGFLGMDDLDRLRRRKISKIF